MVDEGLVRLEEVRGDNGVLENIYVRVCPSLLTLHSSFHANPSL